MSKKSGHSINCYGGQTVNLSPNPSSEQSVPSTLYITQTIDPLTFASHGNFPKPVQNK